MIEQGFERHFVLGKFFPRPADITEAIKEIRASMAAVPDYQPNWSREATAAEQSTPEWEKAAEEARATLRRLAGKA